MRQHQYMQKMFNIKGWGKVSAFICTAVPEVDAAKLGQKHLCGFIVWFINS